MRTSATSAVTGASFFQRLMMKTIHKIAAVVIQDNKFLMVRKKGRDIWTSLGGRIEDGETEEQCLLREIKEEASCNAKIIKKLGDFSEKACFDDAMLRLSTYLVELEGEINCEDPELEEVKFIDKDYEEQGIKPSLTITKQIIPFCSKDGLLRW
jgi:8-oxo-dGTP pyrophosphatase MutT (NUDIX family)